MLRSTVFGAAAVLLLSACALHMPEEPAPAAQRDAVAPAPTSRAILVSIDALEEARIRETLPAEVVPNLLAVFDGAACASHAIPAFPSLTASSHSALWTGAFGDVSGVTANTQLRLPKDAHDLLDLTTGFSHEVQRAEPIWITAAREGVRVVGHHTTQAPHPPAFPPEISEWDDRMEARRADARAVLDRPEAMVLNGYNRSLSGHRILTEADAEPGPATGWRNLDRLGAIGVDPLEIAWEIDGDSAFAVFYGETELTSVAISRSRDAGSAVIAHAAPPETGAVEGRDLARHFSEGLEWEVAGGRSFLRVRLFDLSASGTRFLLYQAPMHVVEGNRADVQAAYDDAVRGWIGNAPHAGFVNGQLGPPRWEGGDGTAELRYLETVELITRQYMRGAEWAWNEVGARLLADYFPLADAVDHSLLGHLDPRSPFHDPLRASYITDIRERVWAMVDLRVGHLRDLVAGDGNAALFLTGDHGMRTTWASFSPNAVLVEAGLAHLDEHGRVDLSRSRAVSPNGYWININTTDRSGGIVPPGQRAEVLAEVERALLAAQDSVGNRIVTEIYRPEDHPELGIGGPAGGDLYFGTREGIQWTWRADVPVIALSRPFATHGFPSIDRDMWTAFCAEGAGFSATRIGEVRVIDAAPTVADYIGIGRPWDAVGTSVLNDLRGRD
jgi:hypothetical protein